MALEFPANLSIESCEEFVAQLANTESVESLVLPEGTRNIAFGSYAAAIQAVNTWARKSQGRNILIKEAQSDVDGRVDELLSKPHKFCASMFARSILIEKQGDDLRPLVNRAAREIIERQGQIKFGQQRGGLCWFAFVDHSTRGFDRNFYLHGPEEKPTLRGQLQFRSVISTMVSKSTDVMGGAESLSDEDKNYLGRAFYELFLNTHEHGSRSSVRNKWLLPGVRVIYTNGINLTAASVDVRGVESVAMKRYFSSLDELPKERRRFMEISVVDSGLGYEGRWRADNMEIDGGPSSLQKEYEIFKKCFTFRQTSAGTSLKGHGLPVVMDRLTKLKAFMRVRSGRLSLCRDFVAHPFQSDDGCEFEDWYTQSFEERTEMAPVSGVAITFLIPLEFRE